MKFESLYIIGIDTSKTSDEIWIIDHPWCLKLKVMKVKSLIKL